jgi:hypothetical protein
LVAWATIALRGQPRRPGRSGLMPGSAIGLEAPNASSDKNIIYSGNFFM